MGSEEVGKLFLEAIIQHRGDSGSPQNFDTAALSGLSNVLARSGSVTCDMFVDEKVQNRFGTLHGGCIATIVDVVGTAALMTQSPKSGVSLSISVDYLSPQPAGETVEVHAEILKAGKTIATVAVELRHKESRRLVASGRHIKFLAGGERVLEGLEQRSDELARARL